MVSVQWVWKSHILSNNSQEYANVYLNNRRNNETKRATETAYKLVKQDEEVEEMTNKWWGYLRQLKN